MAEPVPLRTLLADTRTTIAAVVDTGSDTGDKLRQAWPLVGDAVDSGVAAALDVDLIGLLAQGWSKAAELRGYTDAEKYPPSKIARMTLAKHDMKLAVDPELTVTLGGAPLHKLALVIEFTATVHAATLTIRAGAITALGLGRIGLAAKVRYAGTELPLPLKQREIEIPGTLALEPPLAIAALLPGIRQKA